MAVNRPDPSLRGTPTYMRQFMRWAADVANTTGPSASKSIRSGNAHLTKPTNGPAIPPTTNASQGRLPKPPTETATPPVTNDSKTRLPKPVVPDSDVPGGTVPNVTDTGDGE